MRNTTARGNPLPTKEQFSAVKSALAENPGMSAKEVAAQLGLHSNVVTSVAVRSGAKIYPATVVFKPTQEQRLWLRQEADRLCVSCAGLIGLIVNDAINEEAA